MRASICARIISICASVRVPLTDTLDSTLYALADFVVIETDTDQRAPIILGRPFLNTSGAVIYASAAKISFYIKGKKETFSFENKITQILEQSRHELRKRTNRRNRNKQMWTETAKLVTAVQGGQHR